VSEQELDLIAWLHSLGLERYARTFLDAEVTPQALLELTDADLRELGLPLGPRKVALKAIRVLARGLPKSPASEETAKTAHAHTAAAPSAAERRQLTVTFVDLVGSTALAARLDPEDLRDIIGAYHRCVAKIVMRFEGFVAKYMGDGVLVYFGYPRAHEDDAERAVRAGLALVDAVGQLPVSERLQVRVGIATGTVVVGDLVGAGEAQERGVVGETPNLAARLQAVAGPDSVVIAASTRRLTGGLFEYQDLGAVEAKGFSGPVSAWRVLAVSTMDNRFEALHGAAPSALIGREEEIELLLRRWQRAKDGEGQAVLLSAEPGFGKSRLMAALQQRVGDEPYARLRYFTSPHHSDSALYAVISQFERAAGFERNDLPETKLDRLEALLRSISTPKEDLALLAELVSLPTDRYPPPAITLEPAAKKQRTLEALMRQLEFLSRCGPVLILFEDVRWIDPSSLELLHLTVQRLPTLPALLLITFRPEFTPPWVGQPHVTSMALGRLNRRDSAALVAQVVGGAAPPPEEVVGEIVERTDGVPLFIEELTKAVLEAGSEAATATLARSGSQALAIPATLHASLMARLDRLGPAAKEVAEIGAAIGREFSYELLAAVARRTEADLASAVDALARAGLIIQRGSPPRADFTFNHALVQDAAYSTLLRQRKQELHRRIAENLRAQSADGVQPRPEVLARHFSQAGRPDRALYEWQRAGEMSLRRSAPSEALAHFSAALAAVPAISDESARERLELDLRLGLGTAMIVLRGPSRSEIGVNYSRAVALGRTQGQSKSLARALWGSWYHAHALGSRDSLTIADELVQVAEQLGDDALALEAYHARWASSFLAGRHAVTLADAERGVAMYDERRHHSHSYEYGGHDTGVCARAHYAIASWITGFPERAARTAAEAIQLGERLGHRASLTHAAWWSALVFQLRREPTRCRELAELAIRTVREQGGTEFHFCPLLVGWAEFETGAQDEGLSTMTSAISTTRQSGRRTHYAQELCIVADALRRSGAPEHALDLVEEAHQTLAQSHFQVYKSEVCRLQATCLEALGRPASEIEPWLTRALRFAVQTNARSFKLRAATSHARLRRDKGQCGEARALLAPVYGGFTEGFDTPDLKEAKELLDEL
jgi:class 3 adenylate cyclase/predicted ATPase